MSGKSAVCVCVCLWFGVFAKSLLSGKIGVCIAIRACKRISDLSVHKAKCQAAHSKRNDIQRNRCSLDEIANINHKNQPQMRIKRVNYPLNNLLFLVLAFESKHFSVSLSFAPMYPCYTSFLSLPSSFLYFASCNKTLCEHFVCIFQTKHRIMGGGSLNPIFWLMVKCFIFIHIFHNNSRLLAHCTYAVIYWLLTTKMCVRMTKETRDFSSLYAFSSN